MLARHDHGFDVTLAQVHIETRLMKARVVALAELHISGLWCQFWDHLRPWRSSHCMRPPQLFFDVAREMRVVDVTNRPAALARTVEQCRERRDDCL